LSSGAATALLCTHTGYLLTVVRPKWHSVCTLYAGVSLQPIFVVYSGYDILIVRASTRIHQGFVGSVHGVVGAPQGFVVVVGACGQGWRKKGYTVFGGAVLGELQSDPPTRVHHGAARSLAFSVERSKSRTVRGVAVRLSKIGCGERGGRSEGAVPGYQRSS
jgi:hypothetical protein